MIVLYKRGRFLPSSHTRCPIVHRGIVGASFCTVLLIAWIARILLCRSLVACPLAVMLLDSSPCSAINGGFHPIRSSLGVKPVMEFAELL